MLKIFLFLGIILLIVGAGCTQPSNRIEELERQVEELSAKVSSTESVVSPTDPVVSSTVTTTVKQEPIMVDPVKKVIQPVKHIVQPVEIQQPALQNDSLEKISNQLEEMNNLQKQKEQEEKDKQKVAWCDTLATQEANSIYNTAINSPSSITDPKCQQYKKSLPEIVAENPQPTSGSNALTLWHEKILTLYKEKTQQLAECVYGNTYGVAMYNCIHNQ
ncbi:MAG: hypothetical protein COU28_03055 [Candidatus Magasanikbacteria bacterium CG10_big_fil_rev_8_21_14_0_10_36_16]|uniref:Uncharacterized protein n=1 Tax=Candidatus Magasanikbacteria bacterium CG10_big_fil_rev_8_21_14_0_10_36_16 TaxID=1974645 RepID=A0A2H0TY77_9BACT|nr:MAG: hypothetical protein COU28_03055 [Candidatus Magasanikbacteria bacterium CG10_big_fil_rev_8_21_14_0_10_36_16]